MTKKLYKSTKDRKVAGVCGGLAEYFDTDVTLVRIAAAILILCWGSGLLAYIIMAIALKDDPGYLDAGSADYTVHDADQ